jgi:RNA polymerase sigma-70 factor (ECF subfamily)
MPNQAPDFEPYRQEVLAWFRRRVRDPQDAEDLCQDTYARLIERARPLREADKVRPYLFTAARNVLINRLRRRQIVGSVDAAGEPIDPDSLATPHRDDPEANAQAAELRQRLEMLLETLPSEQRTAFELGVMQRLLYSEIARSTGWSPAKVKVNVFRARKKLIAGLRAYQRDPSDHDSPRVERER